MTIISRGWFEGRQSCQKLNSVREVGGEITPGDHQLVSDTFLGKIYFNLYLKWDINVWEILSIFFQQWSTHAIRCTFNWVHRFVKIKENRVICVIIYNKCPIIVAVLKSFFFNSQQTNKTFSNVQQQVTHSWCSVFVTNLEKAASSPFVL